MSKSTIVAVAVCAAIGTAGAYAWLQPGTQAATAAMSPVAEPNVPPSAVLIDAPPALKLDAGGSEAFALRIERGRRQLTDEEHSRLAALAPSLASQPHKITGKEPAAPGQTSAARQVAFERAFAARIVLAEHGVDPKLGRIFYLTRGAGLESGLEVLPMAGEQLASLKGVRARAKRADSPLASIPQGSARVTLAATNQGLVGAPAAMVTMATALEVGLPASAQQSLPLAPFAAALLSENKPRRFV